jgi:cellulose synthase operon protein C
MPFDRFRIAPSCMVAALALTIGLGAPNLASAATEETQSYVNDATARIAKGDIKGAEVQLRNAERGDPTNASINIQLAELYLQLQNLPAAEVEARLARTNKGDPDKVDPVLAQVLLQSGKFNELFRDVKPGDREAKAESRVRMTLGMAHLNLRELDEAKPLLQEAESRDSEAGAPKAAMAQLLLAQGNPQGAQKEIDAAMAVAPDDPNVMHVDALVLRASGSADAAIKKLSELLAKNPNDLAGLAIRAETYMGENKLKEAQADVDQALKLSPGQPGIIFLNGVLLARLGKLADADAQLSKVATTFNNNPYGYLLQGIVKYQLGQTEQAATSLSKYIARFPKEPVARRLLARISLGKRDFKGAIETLKPLVDASPGDYVSAQLLAQAYLASGRRNDALEIYQKAAQLDPSDLKAAANLAAMQAGMGRVDLGLGQLEKIAQTAEGAEIAGPTLVIGDLRAGRIADAAKNAEALVQRNNKDIVAQNLLGTVRMAQADYAGAAAIFKAIVDRDPTLLGVQRALAQAYTRLDKLGDAKAVLQGLVKRQPDSTADVIALARVEARQGDEAGAADLLKKAQQSAVKDPSPGLALLQLYGAAKERDKAQAYARDLEGFFPANAAVIDAVATLKTAAGDPRGAATEFAKLVQASPDAPAVLMRYALYQNAAGDKAGAGASLRKAVVLAPHDAGAMEALVSFEMSTDGADAALAAAQSFAKSEPQISKLLSADVLAQAGHADQAVELLAAEQKERPSDVTVARLGELLYATGKHDEAKRLLTEWIKDHDDAGPRISLATIYASEHADDQARALYEAAHEKQPYNLVLLNNLALLYANKRDGRALDLAAMAYRMAPSPNTADTLAWVLVSDNRAKDALPLLHDANTALPKNPSIAYHFAVALNATGQEKEARTVLEPIIRSGASFDDEAAAQQLLKKL